MRIAKRILLGIGLFLVLAVALLYGINLFDEDLDPQVQSFLAQKFTVPDSAEKGDNYLIGIRVPKNQDPAIKGAEIFLRGMKNMESRPFDAFAPSKEERSLPIPSNSTPCFTDHYCPKAKYKANLKAIEQGLKGGEVALKRLNKLISFGSFGSGQAPSAYAHEAVFLLSVSRLKLLQLSSNLHRRKVREVANQLVKMNAFFTQSLQYPHTMIETMILVVLLDANRQFFASAIKQYPELKKLLKKSDMQSFQLNMDFESLTKFPYYVELTFHEAILSRPFDLNFYDTINVVDNRFSNNEKYIRILNSVLAPLQKKNRTLNLHFKITNEILHSECMRTEVQCDPKPIVDKNLGNPFINPIGKWLTKVTATQIGLQFSKLHQRVKDLNEPLIIK